MKNIEAIIPDQSVDPTIEQLQELGVQQVTVEPVRVFKKNSHQTMVYRGHEYERGFVSESKLRFAVSDQDAPRAETIVAQVSH